MGSCRGPLLAPADSSADKSEEVVEVTALLSGPAHLCMYGSCVRGGALFVCQVRSGFLVFFLIYS